MRNDEAGAPGGVGDENRLEIDGQHLAPRAAGARSGGPANTTIWIADKAGDLPEWFVIGNDRLRDISVERPDLEDVVDYLVGCLEAPTRTELERQAAA